MDDRVYIKKGRNNLFVIFGMEYCRDCTLSFSLLRNQFGSTSNRDYLIMVHLGTSNVLFEMEGISRER